MSNEILESNRPFDGHAVDMWALGPMLFMMVSGSVPWDYASLTDQRFRHCSEGNFVSLAKEWNLGLSPDLIDLLQRMFFKDPKDRLSLNQVKAHPWLQKPVHRPYVFDHKSVSLSL